MASTEKGAYNTRASSSSKSGDLSAQKNGTRRASTASNMADLTAGAKAATDSEVNMPVWEALKLHKRAVGWSLLLSTAVIMEGYDTTLIYNVSIIDGRPVTETHGQTVPRPTRLPQHLS